MYLDSLASALFSSLVIQMIGTFFFLQWIIIFDSSGVSPELEIKIIVSLDEIIPKSPWFASQGCIKKDGVPIEEKVEEIFLQHDHFSPYLIQLLFLLY